jgi:hypothetical protein
VPAQIARFLTKLNKEGALMCLMRSGPIARTKRLFEAYERDDWPVMIDKLIELLRATERTGGEEADLMAGAIKEAVCSLTKGFSLAQCRYVKADPPLQSNMTGEEIEAFIQVRPGYSEEALELEGRMAKYFSHYFICRSARRVPKWCPDCTLAARQRTHRQKERRTKRSGRYI